ncbi:MAG: YebC/PmpR family DNA-binding transcriptional regulator [Proteobacteria bacterium]|jgi:YebC/PmpR family DNA-binding regulatory protein|nr:YebC/PmpR family DNA-binding transcriptional regulator [Pseudomonadota bacterium]
MGRQWLLAKREVASLKKSKSTGKFVREITIAARQGGADPENNARLFAALEKARAESVSKDVIERAINKGAGIGGEKAVIDHIVFEGYAPHKVPVIVEVYTDNTNRTTPELRVLFRNGQLGAPGSNKFLFDHVGLVEAYTNKAGVDLEEAAIEAGANEVETLTHDQNDDIPADQTGARFITERTATAAVTTWLKSNGWNVVTSEIGYVAKNFPTLTDEQRAEAGEFLQALEEHDDVHRVWTAIK